VRPLRKLTEKSFVWGLIKGSFALHHPLIITTAVATGFLDFTMAVICKSWMFLNILTANSREYWCTPSPPVDRTLSLQLNTAG
jgi:hypothetical protein